MKVDVKAINLGDLLKHIISDIEEEMNENGKMKVPVGKMDDGLVAHFRYYAKTKNELRDAMKLKQKEIEMRVKRELEEAMEPFEEELEKVHTEFWEHVVSHNGLDPNVELNVDPKERVVYQYVEIEKTNLN